MPESSKTHFPTSVFLIFCLAAVLYSGCQRTLQRAIRGPVARQMTFSSQGLLATGNMLGELALWDIEKGEVLGKLPYEFGSIFDIQSLAFSPDGTMLAMADKNVVQLWDMRRVKVFQVLFNNKESPVYKDSQHPRLFPQKVTVAFSPNGKMLAAGAFTVRIWDLLQDPLNLPGADKVNEDFRLELKEARHFVTFSPDSKTLACLGRGYHQFSLWDTTTGELIKEFSHGQERKGSWDIVDAVAFSPDGKTLASCGGATLKLWDAGTGALRMILESPKKNCCMHSVAFSHDGSLLASSNSDDHAIYLWDPQTGELRHTLQQVSPVTSFSFAPNSGLLISGDDNGVLLVWDLSAR